MPKPKDPPCDMPKANAPCDCAYLEYYPDTQTFCITIDGDFAGITLALSKAMRSNPAFKRVVTLACVIHGIV